MPKVERFEDLEIWKEAKELAKDLYGLTERGQLNRDFGFRDQIRRSSVSIMANVAEGFERSGDKEFLQFLAYAKGSCGELRSHLHLAYELGFIPKESYELFAHKAKTISKMIWKLMQYINHSKMKGAKSQL